MFPYPYPQFASGSGGGGKSPKPNFRKTNARFRGVDFSVQELAKQLEEVSNKQAEIVAKQVETTERQEYIETFLNAKHGDFVPYLVHKASMRYAVPTTNALLSPTPNERAPLLQPAASIVEPVGLEAELKRLQDDIAELRGSTPAMERCIIISCKLS